MGTKTQKQRKCCYHNLSAKQLSCDLIEGTIVTKKHLQKYISRAKEPQRTYRRRSTFGSGNDSQLWMNYLEKYTQPVEELMKLTRNKRHFYQRGLRAPTLLRQGS